MKTVKIPKVFNELFGKEITVLELWLTIFTSIAITIVIFMIATEEVKDLPFWRQILLVILTLDITGGIIANLSFSTNAFYKTNSKARLVFLMIHIQPIIVAFLFANFYIAGIAVTVYTIIAGLIVNALLKNPAQRAMGATLMILGITFLLMFSDQLPFILTALFSFYMFKVIYCFAVDHYYIRED
jgi:hypothetical protein